MKYQQNRRRRGKKIIVHIRAYASIQHFYKPKQSLKHPTTTTTSTRFVKLFENVLLKEKNRRKKTPEQNIRI